MKLLSVKPDNPSSIPGPCMAEEEGQLLHVVFLTYTCTHIVANTHANTYIYACIHKCTHTHIYTISQLINVLHFKCCNLQV